MKTKLQILSLALVSAFILSFSGSLSARPTENPAFAVIGITLTNNCSAHVKVYVKSPGSATYQTVETGQKKSFNFEPGTKIYDESGKKLIAEITAASAGKDFIVCK